MIEYADGTMLSEIEDGVGLITFNRPQKRNAMSIGMWGGLLQILDAFETDPAVRAVVLTGASNRAFVSGADVGEFEQTRSDADAEREYQRLASRGCARLAAFPKPTIARIRGYCLGAGLGIALHCDLRIAAVDSAFGMPGASLGMAYGRDIVGKLVSLVGEANARMLLFTGSRIDGEEAARIGLVSRVVEDEELSERVVDLVRLIADNAPLSLSAMKLAVAEATKEAGERDHAKVEQAIDACFDSEDYAEGRTAFLEKRPPRFRGR
jgi:enoyl-CoA hydratase/carnithine racemase